MRKYDVNEINLTIEDIQLSEHSILFSWNSDIGFGEYALYYNSTTDQWNAQSEYMDSNNNKDFGRKLFQLLMDKVNITN